MTRSLQVARLLQEGKTYSEIADACGVSYAAVRAAVNRARLDGDLPPAEHCSESDEDEDDSGERCKCGLRMPCNSCLEPAWVIATRGWGSQSWVGRGRNRGEKR